MRLEKNKGFTLMELLVVMTIMAVLMGLALVSYQGARKTARDGKRKSDLEEIRGALEMCRTDIDSYPGVSFGSALTCDGKTYLNPVPVDPINSAPYVYTYSTPDGSTYTLCAGQLETTGDSYCVYNP